ncbi:unnamed protein product, partial [Prorocentrum cordatum]
MLAFAAVSSAANIAVLLLYRHWRLSGESAPQGDLELQPVSPRGRGAALAAAAAPPHPGWAGPPPPAVAGLGYMREASVQAAGAVALLADAPPPPLPPAAERATRQPRSPRASPSPSSAASSSSSPRRSPGRRAPGICVESFSPKRTTPSP